MKPRSSLKLCPMPATDLRPMGDKIKGRRTSVEVQYDVSYVYNGGTDMTPDGEWYDGFEVSPPILPAGFKLRGLGVGLQHNARPPYATALLVRDTDSPPCQNDAT